MGWWGRLGGDEVEGAEGLLVEEGGLPLEDLDHHDAQASHVHLRRVDDADIRCGHHVRHRPDAQAPRVHLHWACSPSIYGLFVLLFVVFARPRLDHHELHTSTCGMLEIRALYCAV